MKTLLITGAAGQLGQLLQRQYAAQRQFKVLACDSAMLDITDDSALQRLFSAVRPDIVINCAAYTAVDSAEQQPERCMLVNAMASASLAGLCRQYDSLLISFSTDYVFDGQHNAPYTESDPASPLNLYGKSKLLAEDAVVQAGRYITFRTSWLFSALPGNFASTIWRRAVRGEPVSVVSDQLGGPTPASVLAEAVYRLTMDYAAQTFLPYGLYHFCGYPYCSWYDFAKAIYQLAAPQHQHCLTAINSPFPGSLAVRPAYSCLDSSLFQRTFTQPATDWRTEIESYVKKMRV